MGPSSILEWVRINWDESSFFWVFVPMVYAIFKLVLNREDGPHPMWGHLAKRKSGSHEDISKNA